jgi:hypothetical protein
MYCSSCGAAMTQGLSYCNRCGANLKLSESLAPSTKPAGLIWVITFGIAMMGLPFPAFIVIFALIKELKEAGFPLEYLMVLAAISLLTVFGAVEMLSRFLPPLVKAYLQSGEPVESKKSELNGRTPAQLEAAREPASSITENTTRAFEPSYRERNAR